MDADRPTSNTRVDPIPGEPAATATVGDERVLLVADYHAGYEDALRHERGVDVPGRAPDRRARMLALVDRVDPERLVVLGDLMHSIGDPGGAERGELEVLFDSFPGGLDVTIVKGNHDGLIETWLGDDASTDIGGGDPAGSGSRPPADDVDVPTDGGSVTVVPGNGVRLEGLGVCHGHTWPAPDVLEGDVLCLGHEHPCVRLEDEIGGSRVERVWLRGRIDPGPFRDRPEYDDVSWLPDGAGPNLVVVPAFNELVGGTWVNAPNQSFLSPFLPDGLTDGEAYLLDGTRLGAYGTV
ncbi:metallophosphoesterase [Natrarchaeobius sp. A-rgal3]|uniref:metallophosphoesterase n=1 Tax=Natrarchaeobius versutus TaxID=1679078 RepID=UPI00350EA42D